MECVRKTLPAQVIQSFITLPASMMGKELEVIVLSPEEKGIASELRGSVETDISLEEARRERLLKYEITA